MKPNNNQVPELFIDKVVLAQLESSGTVAFFELIETGYPKKVKMNELYGKVAPLLEPRHASIAVEYFCTLILIASGLEQTDFKIGKSDIHIRAGSSDKIDQIICNADQSNNELIASFVQKFKKQFRKFYCRSIIIALKFSAARKLYFV